MNKWKWEYLDMIIVFIYVLEDIIEWNSRCCRMIDDLKGSIAKFKFNF